MLVDYDQLDSFWEDFLKDYPLHPVAVEREDRSFNVPLTIYGARTTFGSVLLSSTKVRRACARVNFET